MKKYFTILIIITCYLVGYGQLECQNTYPSADEILTANAVQGWISSAGDLFYDAGNQDVGNFGAYYPPDSVFARLIYVAGLILGGKDEDGEIRVAWQAYGKGSGRLDFNPGPLDGESGLTDSLTCENWDKVWTVRKSAILQHLNEIETNGMPIIRRASIYNYPAFGNPYFSDFIGFELPNNQEFAPFYDANADGIYNPDDKDYPLPMGVDKNAIPETLMWTVFNDNSREHTESHSEPLGVEVQLTAYAYACTSIPILNHTIFTQHKVINRSGNPIDDFRIGHFYDFDLGCDDDSGMGTAADLNTVYAYNLTSTDQVDCPYFQILSGDNLPVVSFTYLNHSLDNNLLSWNGGRFEGPYQMTFPGTPKEIYNNLSGLWKSGEPQTYGRFAYNLTDDTLETIKHVYPDNPNDTAGWSMLTHRVHSQSGLTGFSGHNVGDFAKNATFRLDQAWSYHRGENGDHLKNVNLMYEQIPVLQELYDNRFANVNCSATSTNAPDENQIIELFPNPTRTEITIQSNGKSIDEIRLYNVRGQEILVQNGNYSTSMQFNLTTLLPQVYFIKIKIGGQWEIMRLIKI